MLCTIFLEPLQIFAIEMMNKDSRKHGEHDDKGFGNKLRLQFDII